MDLVIRLFSFYISQVGADEVGGKGGVDGSKSHFVSTEIGKKELNSSDFIENGNDG